MVRKIPRSLLITKVKLTFLHFRKGSISGKLKILHYNLLSGLSTKLLFNWISSTTGALITLMSASSSESIDKLKIKTIYMQVSYFMLL